jgi:hypothetical protein
MSMMVAYFFTVRESLQAIVWTRLAAFNGDAAGLPWMIVALAVRSFLVLSVLAQRQLDRWFRNVMRRAWHGARFAAHMRPADTMVAAGGR